MLEARLRQIQESLTAATITKRRRAAFQQVQEEEVYQQVMEEAETHMMRRAL